jgi:hypothetical protein
MGENLLRLRPASGRTTGHSLFEELAQRARAARFGAGIEGLALGQGYTVRVADLPAALGAPEGLVLRGSLHVRRDPDADTVAARTLYLLSVELLRTSFPTGLSLPRRAVWSLAAELARVDAPHLAPSLLGRS